MEKHLVNIVADENEKIAQKAIDDAAFHEAQKAKIDLARAIAEACPLYHPYSYVIRETMQNNPDSDYVLVGKSKRSLDDTKKESLEKDLAELELEFISVEYHHWKELVQQNIYKCRFR